MHHDYNCAKITNPENYVFCEYRAMKKLSCDSDEIIEGFTFLFMV